MSCCELKKICLSNSNNSRLDPAIDGLKGCTTGLALPFGLRDGKGYLGKGKGGFLGQHILDYSISYQ